MNTIVLSTINHSYWSYKPIAISSTGEPPLSDVQGAEIPVGDMRADIPEVL